MYPPILFLHRKGLELTALMDLCSENDITFIAANSLEEFVNLIHSKKIVMVVIEDNYISTLAERPILIYQLLALSSVKIQITIGRRSNLLKINHADFDLIISEHMSLEQKFNEINLYWEASKIIHDSETRVNTYLGMYSEASYNQELQNKDRRISSLYIQLLEYRSALRKNYEDWVLMDLPLNHQKVRKFHSKLRANANYTDNHWDEFSEHFVEVHPKFFERLSQMAPSLTEENLRMCAYIKMGVNNNEIAQYMNIQHGSVKKSQTRIKKKLQLQQERSLREFIKHLGTDNI